MTRRPHWTTAIAACMLAVPAGVAGAQRSAADSLRSSLAGVFTTEQAKQGQDIYAGMCRACHTAATHTPTFKAAWSGRPLSDLFEYISETMPQNAPGSLSADEYSLVLAYMLRMLGMPPGGDPLPSDPAALRRIRFDTLSIRQGTDRDG